MNLRRKLLLQFFGLAVCPMALVAAVVAVGAYRHTQGLARNDLFLQLDTVSQHITRTFRSEMFFINNFLEEEFEPVRTPDAPSPTLTMHQLVDVLGLGRFQRILESPPFIDRRLLVLETGHEIAYTLRRQVTRDGVLFLPDSLFTSELPAAYAHILDTRFESSADFRLFTSIDPKGFAAAKVERRLAGGTIAARLSKKPSRGAS